MQLEPLENQGRHAKYKYLEEYEERRSQFLYFRKDGLL